MSGWEHQASAWVAWARKPGHDSYWSYRQSFFELLPAAGRATLEVGCGEGRVARDLASLGHRVTGVDVAPTLVAHAREAHPEGTYRVCRAEELSFADGEFDLVVAYNSLMNVDDMPGAIAEAARVLAPAGRLCACVIHPLASAGRWTESGDFLVDQRYFDERSFAATFERGGLRIEFEDRVYSLELYARGFESAGLLIEAIREPPAPPGYRSFGKWSRLPQFLHLRALKP